MSTWATRCNACGTSFRVSEEQLALSEGYARCGRCDAVFNARATLFDLSAPSAPAPLSEAADEPNFAADEPASDRAGVSVQAPEPVAESEPFPETVVPALAAQEGISTEPTWQAEAVAEPVDPREPQWSAADADRMRELLGAPAAEAAPSATWSSLQSDSSRRKARPSPRWALASAGAFAAMLALALPAHWAWIERDALRARHAALDSWLDTHAPAARNPTGWRQLEGLSVSSSSLRATPQGGAYQLELVVNNRATHALAMPWLDLNLSDSKGQLLLRRAIDPATLTGGTRPLGVNEQRKLLVVFKVDGANTVANYEIGLFHP